MRKLIDPNELEYMQIGTNAYVRVEDILSAPSVDAVPREIEQANKQAVYVKGYEDGQKDKYGQWVDAVPVIRCDKCDFWDRNHISCEGLAKCLTGEGGIRYRNRSDFCSRGVQMDSE